MNKDSRILPRLLPQWSAGKSRAFSRVPEMGFAHNPKRHEANGREAVKKVDGKIGWSENLQRRTQKQRETE